MLIHKFWLANEGEIISDEALESYVQLFEQPLADMHIKAILALFGCEPLILPLFEHNGMVEDMQ